MFKINSFINSIFSGNDKKKFAKFNQYVNEINSLESKYEILSQDELLNCINDLNVKIKNGKKLNECLVEAFAIVREASKRTLQQRHFDVQLMGGMVLHEGGIAEMKTGEGKTLV